MTTVTTNPQEAEAIAGKGDVENLRAALNRYCLSLTGSRWEAEDLAQDAWVKAWSTLREAGHRNAEAFLLRIAKNTWIDITRRKRALARLLPLETPADGALDEGAFETERLVGALVKHLSPLQRAVFLLREVFGFTSAETAARLRTTEGAVKASLHRARHALAVVRQELQKDDEPEPKDEGLKTFIRTLAAAYRQGDIARLAELAQQDVLQPVTAIGLAQSRLLRQRQAAEARAASFPTARMAA